MNLSPANYWVRSIIFQGRETVWFKDFEMQMIPLADDSCMFLRGKKSGYFEAQPLCAMAGQYLGSIAYEIHGLGSDGQTLKVAAYEHTFKRNKALVEYGDVSLVIARKLFRTQPLSDLLDSHLFNGLKGVQFVA